MREQTISTKLMECYKKAFPAPERYENYFMACEAIGYLRAIIKHHIDNPLIKAIDDLWMQEEIDLLREKAHEGVLKDFLDA